MSRYRKDPTRPDAEIAKLAEKTRALRIELQGMVKRRRRSDVLGQPPPTRTPVNDPKKR